MKKSKHFKLTELLPKEVYIDENHGCDLMDDSIIDVIDWLKGLVGNSVRLIINNWNIGGARNNCGYRTADCTVGAPNSRHKKGLAVDIISPDMTAEELRDLVELNKDTLPWPVRIEKNVTWLHIDTDNTTDEKIYYFNG